jgi:hypothetical protein
MYIINFLNDFFEVTMKSFTHLSKNFKNKKNNLVFAFALMFSFLSIFSTSNAKSPYCTPSAGSYYTCTYMWITNVTFNTINNTSGCGEYSDYSSSVSTDIKKNKSYTIGITCYGYPMQYNVWIDYNQNGEFEKEELVVEVLNGNANSEATQTITIPATAKGGKTVMRIMADYQYQGASYDPCYINYYGEVEDYQVNIVSDPDASICQIPSPISPFTVGNQTVIATIKNYGDPNLTSAKIFWAVNNVPQNSPNGYSWTGNLKKGDSANVVLGTYNFSYPAAGPFNPFNITAYTSNPNGLAIDDDPSNDSKTVFVTPILNDCGVIGFFGPPEGFGAGLTAVKARVRNYAPKPLTKVTINWKMDGTTQTPVTISGLNIQYGQYSDLDVGSYLFYNKTPLGPFNVECWTTNPNNIVDEDQTNDKYTGGIGPSLTAGTYKIGGSNAHFPSIVSAASYLNSGGVFGTGTVYFDVRQSATPYTGQIVLSNPLANANTIVFRSESGRYSDVMIEASPTGANNFVVQISNMSNVQFRDMTISNKNSNISLAGRVFDISNAANTMIYNCLVNGVAKTNTDPAYSSVVLNNAGIDIMKSNFYGGSIAVDGQSPTTQPINLSDNSFFDFSSIGSKILGNQYSGLISLNNNGFKSQGTVTPRYGVWIEGPGKLANNVFDNINGTGNANEGVIKIVHSVPVQSYIMTLYGNVINNCSNINGLKIDNAYVYIDRNYINISQTLTNMNALGYFANSQGVMGNNVLIGKNIYGFHAHNMSNFDFIYNSLNITGGAGSAIHSINADYTAMRNIFINKGNGYVYEINGGKPILKENTFKSVSTNFANANGTNYSVLATWFNAQFDKGSRIADVTYLTAADLHIFLYIPEIMYGVALFAGDNSLAGNLERTDYDGETRTSYYAGADEIFLAVNLIRQSTGFVDCEKSTKNSLTVSSEINYGAIMTYQWDKDGIELPGKTEPVLYFKDLKFLESGLYKCKIGGPGTTQSIYSKPVAVYVSTPTFITVQPKDEILAVGSKATFTFTAHVNGKKIEDAIINEEVKVQWYKYISEAQSTLLTDIMPRIAGSKSNYLTINNFVKSDFGKYYAEITGLCGIVKTTTAQLIEEKLDVTIIQQPTALTNCEGTDAIFNADATSQSAKVINYQWFKDGIALSENLPQIEGTNSKHLLIYGIDNNDAGEYYATVSLDGTTITKQTDKVKLNVKAKPAILTQPKGVTLKVGEDLSLEVAVADINDPSVKYQWIKDTKQISNATASKYVKAKVTSDDQGQYLCVITNDCGTIISDKIMVVITTGTTDVTDVQSNGYSLSVPSPSPINQTANVKYFVPNQTNVRISISDIQGSFETELVNQMVITGEHFVTINVNQMNISSGTYFLKLESSGVVLVQKIVVIK